MNLFLDPDIPLTEACDSNDKCADRFGQCRNGVCQCQDQYYIKDGRCSMYTSVHITDVFKRFKETVIKCLLYHS